MIRRSRAIVALGLASSLSLFIGRGAGPTFAGFGATTSNSADTFAAAADWVAPSVSSTVIAKTAGGTPGFIRQGGTYFVYANVTDTGNPASGVSTVKANIGTITTGQTSVTLNAGSFSVGGVTYNRRTSSVTANASLATHFLRLRCPARLCARETSHSSWGCRDQSPSRILSPKPTFRETSSRRAV